MRIFHSHNASTLNQKGFLEALSYVSKDSLTQMVKQIAIPRHFVMESINNHLVAKWIMDQLLSFGYQTNYQGKYSNIVAHMPQTKSSKVLLVGAHYDSVPDSPGADDNASAVAALLECARIVAEFFPQLAVYFVAFNCEEDGLKGSLDFVARFLPQSNLEIKEVHILEMVGYAQYHPGSQSLPQTFPIKIPDVGDFLGLVGNNKSHFLVDAILQCAKSYAPHFPVLGLKVSLGLEKVFSDLLRSDHSAFWNVGIPAVMWTDTSEFRNPHYHLATDVPETLDYDFLQRVTSLLLVSVLEAGKKYGLV